MEKKKTNMVAIVTMCFIFAMISFVTNMAAPFGVIWGNKFEWSRMAGNLMNFAAYLFMGIPAGKMLLKIGYKNTTLAALAALQQDRRRLRDLCLSSRSFRLRFLRLYAQYCRQPDAQHPRWRW